jgi:Fic family protein
MGLFAIARYFALYLPRDRSGPVLAGGLASTPVHKFRAENRRITIAPQKQGYSTTLHNCLRSKSLLMLNRPERNMSLNIEYRWKPIEPLSNEERAIDLSDILPLSEGWKQFKSRLKVSNPTGLRQFNERLIRSLSIETGILERIYDLDRGTTEALIAKGFVEDLIQRESTNIEPSTLVDILRDQEAAIYLVQDLIANARPFTRGVLLELHAILTRHQPTTIAVDQFGNRMEVPLRRGAFKEHPNNPRRPDDSIHEYAPPEHVISEVDNLLVWLDSYKDDNPLLVSSWLHHRFTQIHPFQDGNGRVARVITTMVLLREGLLPLVVDRSMRTNYISALESADRGRLEPLAGIFAALEKNAILQALSLDVEAEQQAEKSLTGAVIESLEAKFNKRRQVRRQELLVVNTVAQQLRSIASESVERSLRELTWRVFLHDERPDVRVIEGGPDRGNSHWYKFEVTQLNERLVSKKWINFSQGQYFVKAAVQYEKTRLVFVVSFHHIGRELTGVMEVTSFLLLETFDEAEEDILIRGERVGSDVIPSCLEPFVITWNTVPEKVEPAFNRWLDQSLAIAMKEWGDKI